MAAFKASARSLDQGVGAVLDALDEHGLADDTLVIFTTDHGLAVPGRQGDADRPRHRRDADPARAGRLPRRPGVRRARLPDRPLPDDLRARRDRAAGVAAGPLAAAAAARRGDEVHDAIFAEITYHAAYEPQRAVRTRRYKYIRRFDDRRGRCSPNIDDGPSKDLLLAARLGRARAAARGALRPRLRPGRGEQPGRRRRTARSSPTSCARGCDAGCDETDDPLLDGPVARARGAELNGPDQLSPAEPANGHVLDPAGSVH